jgi:putative DNA primase/helicase
MNTGKGSNGKSILFGILFALLGKENVSAKTIHDFEKNHFASSALENKLANICADVGNKGITETEALKKIISGDPIDCERKFMDGYSFMPYSTLIFSANEIPDVHDESDGFARRFELIPWEKSFYGDDRDNTIKTIRKDPGELSGIFNKISSVAKELLETHSLKFESTVEDAKLLWLQKSDSTHLFLDELCARGQDYFITIPRLFSKYNEFCKDRGMTPFSDRKFNSKLEKLGLSRTQKKVDKVNMKVWFGVTLRSELTKSNQSLN